jgi:hypothetical protein
MAQKDQLTNFDFSLILKKNLLSVYVENTLMFD